MAEYPIVGCNIILILSRRMSELEERFREVATEKVTQRLAFALLRLVSQIGKPLQEGIEVSITREELAQLTSSSVFTIGRIISKWAGEGLLLARREAVVVLNTKLLGRLRNGDGEGSAPASAKTTLH